MNNKHSINYDLMTSGSFLIDSISAVHHYIETPGKYIRYSNEHSNDRLICIMSGTCSFDMFNDNPVIASNGDVVYIPHNIAYRTEWLNHTKGEIYSINYTMKNTDGYQITICPEIVCFDSCDSYISEGIFKNCCDTFQSEEYAYILKCKYILMKLMYTIAKSENSSNRSKISKAVNYIESNYIFDMSVTELAKMCNLGECMFRRCFKAEYGISPLKYRNRLRIEKAYEMLVSDNCSVAEAMEATGFYDASYFNKTFKMYKGKSPSECKNPEHTKLTPSKKEHF